MASIAPPPANFPIVDLKTGLLMPAWQQYIQNLTIVVNYLWSYFVSGVLQQSAGGTGVGTLTGTTGSVTSKLVFSGQPTFDSTIGVGAATASASGAGVTFPATANPSTNVNTLDDYEEGTWTPVVGGTATYTTQVGTYTKIGRVVTVKCRLVINLIGTGSTSTISGLPFAIGDRSSLAVSSFANLALSVVWIGADAPDGTSTIVMNGTTAAAASSTDPIAVFGNSAAVRITGQYSV